MNPPKYIASQVPDENGDSIILEGNSLKEIREEIRSFTGGEIFNIYKLIK
jgi:hypothetical protein